MEINVGDIYVVTDNTFYRVYEVHSNYVMVERLGTKTISSDFDIEKYRKAAEDQSNFTKFGDKWFWGYEGRDYRLTLVFAPSEIAHEKFKMMIDKNEELLKSGKQRLYIEYKHSKYTGPITYKTTMLNDYNFLPKEIIEQIMQIWRECREKAASM